jgi:hypothetical protein
LPRLVLPLLQKVRYVEVHGANMVAHLPDVNCQREVLSGWFD